MRARSVHESSRRGIVRRVLVAVMALAAIFTLGACKATGGGQIDDPVPSGVLPPGVPPFEPPDGTYTGEANFGFNFTCEMRDNNKAVIQGQITYHDTGTSIIEDIPYGEVRIHGVVDPVILTAEGCEEAAQDFLDMAQFNGTYRSQDTRYSALPPGRFSVLVFDQGEPGRTKDAFETGDGFAIELTAENDELIGDDPPYLGYTRAGYIEGGNIQVDNT
jgi:hypothetical protein